VLPRTVEQLRCRFVLPRTVEQRKGNRFPAMLPRTVQQRTGRGGFPRKTAPEDFAFAPLRNVFAERLKLVPVVLGTNHNTPCSWRFFARVFFSLFLVNDGASPGSDCQPAGHDWKSVRISLCSLSSTVTHGTSFLQEDEEVHGEVHGEVEVVSAHKSKPLNSQQVLSDSLALESCHRLSSIACRETRKVRASVSKRNTCRNTSWQSIINSTTFIETKDPVHSRSQVVNPFLR